MEAAEQQVCTSRRRQRTKFFEETESKTKPRKARDTPKKDPRKRKTESNSTPPRKKPKVSPPLSTHDKPEKQPVLAQCLPELKATPMTSIFSTKNSCEANLSSQLDADLYLRVCMGESRMQRLQQQILDDQLHAHEENQRLHQLLTQQRAEELQNELTLLRAMCYMQQKK